MVMKTIRLSTVAVRQEWTPFNTHSKRFIFLLVLSLGWPAWAQLPPIPQESGTATEPKPKLHVAHRRHDLGVVFEGEKYPVQWLLENRGDADLVIDHTRATCGCTVVQLDEKEKVIPPGASLTFKAEFNTTARRGAQTKTVSVYSNDPAEPVLKLEFSALVEMLFEVRPPSLVNLRSIQRGQTATKTIDILPTGGRKSVELVDMEVPEGSPLRFTHKPFTAADGVTGERIRMTVLEHASLGPLTTRMTLTLHAEGAERKRVVPIRGQIVGDLTWHPKVVDDTRHASRPGKRFAPVTIRSTDKMPFDILHAEAGAWFDVVLEPTQNRPTRTQYSVFLTLRADAPAGPLGTTLAIRTSSLDQPVIRVPVFGVVAAPVKVDPPVIVLRQDGTERGIRRHVKLQVVPQVRLEVLGLHCDHEAVVAAIDRKASASYRHIRYLNVRLGGTVPQGTHEAVLTVTTNIPEAQKLTIPVIIEVP